MLAVFRQISLATLPFVSHIEAVRRVGVGQDSVAQHVVLISERDLVQGDSVVDGVDFHIARDRKRYGNPVIVFEAQQLVVVAVQLEVVDAQILGVHCALAEREVLLFYDPPVVQDVGGYVQMGSRPEQMLVIVALGLRGRVIQCRDATDGSQHQNGR